MGDGAMCHYCRKYACVCLSYTALRKMIRNLTPVESIPAVMECGTRALGRLKSYLADNPNIVRGPADTFSGLRVVENTQMDTYDIHIKSATGVTIQIFTID